MVRIVEDVVNVIGDSFRGATWVSIHNGGGVGWGEVINGGFGMVIDGTELSDNNIESMMLWDVANGIARRAWGRNPGAVLTAQNIMEQKRGLNITIPVNVDQELIDKLF